MKIDDGKGSGIQAEVNIDNQLSVFSASETRAAHEADHSGRVFFFTDIYNYAAADTILWLANTSTTQRLVIDKVHVTSDTTTQFTIHSPTYAAPAGTSVTGTNSNRQSGATAQAECYRDETNNAQANIIAQGIVLANTEIIFPVDGKIILAYHDTLAVDFVTVGTLGGAVFVAYYVDPEST